MGLVGGLLHCVDGQPHTRCVRRRCSSEQYQYTGFCFDHAEEIKRQGQYGLLEVNRSRKMRGLEPVASMEESRASGARRAAPQAERDIDPKYAFRQMEEELGVPKGTLWAMSSDQDFGDER